VLVRPTRPTLLLSAEVPFGPVCTFKASTTAAASTLHRRPGAPIKSTAVATDARESPASHANRRYPPARALLARFCFDHASCLYLVDVSVFGLRGKVTRAPRRVPAAEEMGLTVQQVPENERATVSFVPPDRPRLHSAEVPFGPVCTFKASTTAAASTLHRRPGAPIKSTAVATALAPRANHARLTAAGAKGARHAPFRWRSSSRSAP